MTKRTKNILSFIVLPALIIVIGIWKYAFDYGTIEITAGLNDYSIKIEEVTTLCATDPCKIKLKSGIYEIIFEKEGYNQIKSKILVARGETSPMPLVPKKTIVLTQSDIVENVNKPKIATPPDFNSKYSAIASTWNDERNKFLFLDKEDGRLKIIDLEGNISPVTVLKNIETPIEFYWSADEKRILGIKENDFYFIDAEIGSRKKQIIEFAPSNVLWSPKNEYILFNNEDNSVFRIDWDKQNYIYPLNTIIDLSLSVWVNNEQLLIHKFDEIENKTSVLLYNPTNSTMEQLTQKFDFPVDDIYFDQEINTGFLHDSGENQWYKLEL
ncbi:hypothetical protein JW758_02815 [Candidatus Peregrinibacteria bacterium]|nr:hypothetical protein [Candidatus Peregrinibacteria bacterium]